MLLRHIRLCVRKKRLYFTKATVGWMDIKKVQYVTGDEYSLWLRIFFLKKLSGETVNIVCLHFSPECSQLSQSFYFLEYRIKIVFKVHVKLLGNFYVLIDENIHMYKYAQQVVLEKITYF